MKNVTSDFLSYHYYSAKKPQNWDKMSVVSSCLVTNKKKKRKKEKKLACDSTILYYTKSTY